MAKYRIKDASGRTMVVSGERPPTEEEIVQLFAAAPAPASAPEIPPAPTAEMPKQPSTLDILNELVAGFDRPIAGALDIATSPYQTYRYLTGNPMQSFQSRIGERGSFAGEGTVGQAAALMGEFTSSALNIGQAGRFVVSNVLDDAARAGESTFRGVLRQLGSSKPIEDIVAGATSGAGTAVGGSVGEKAAGENGRAVGEALGGFGVPVVLAPVLNRLISHIDDFVKAAAPSSQEVKGASRALYKQIEDMGIVFNERATNKIVKGLENVAAAEDLAGLRSDSTVSTMYRKIMGILRTPGEFTGVKYTMVDKMSSDLRTMAADADPAKANNARIAKKLADSIDEFLFNVDTPDFSVSSGPTPGFAGSAASGTGSNVVPFRAPGTGVGPRMNTSGPQTLEGEFTRGTTGAPVAPLSTLGEENTIAVGKALAQARTLWRRGSAAQAVEKILADAKIEAMGPNAGDPRTYITNQLKRMLIDPPAALTAADKAEITKALSGSSVRKLSEFMAKFGIRSHDYLLATMTGSLATYYVRGSVGEAAAAGAAATAGLKTLAVMSDVLAHRMFKSDVHMARAAIAAGPDARALARIYMSRTPPSKRNPAELATLFLKSGADRSILETAGIGRSSFVADSAAYAAMLENAIAEEEQQQ